MALICIHPPLAEPVDLTELKEMLRLDPGDTSQDNVLATLRVAARDLCETITQRRFVRQSWRLMLDFFPGYIDMKLSGTKVSQPFVSGSNALLVGIRYAVVLPYPPVRSLDNFIYQNANGDVTSMITSPASFLQDLQSQPARLTPIFGQMWPVARVVVNAIQIDFTVGYAGPMSVTTTANSAALSGGTFTEANIGQPISIPGAGSNGRCLNSVVQSVAAGIASVRDVPALAVTNATALLVDYGLPGHWELIKLAIKLLVNDWFIHRLPNMDPKASAARAAALLLTPVKDARY
jgi:hypothetical protein